MALKGIPKEGKHTNVASGGHLTWSVRAFSEEKHDSGEMTAKELSPFRRIFRVLSYSFPHWNGSLKNIFRA